MSGNWKMLVISLADGVDVRIKWLRRFFRLLDYSLRCHYIKSRSITIFRDKIEMLFLII